MLWQSLHKTQAQLIQLSTHPLKQQPVLQEYWQAIKHDFLKVNTRISQVACQEIVDKFDQLQLQLCVQANGV